MNRIYIIIAIFAAIVGYLVFTNHTPLFSIITIAIAFIGSMVAADKVLSKPNEKEKKWVEKLFK